MRGKWMEKVKPQTKAVIWRVELDEVRMVQAFVAVEASEHGELPMFFLDFSVPFQTYNDYGRSLIDHWLARWENEEARKKLSDTGALPQWDAEPFKQAVKGHGPEDFLTCMSSFAKEIKGMSGRLVLCLMPPHCDDKKGLVKWIEAAVARVPDNLCILLYDLIENSLFEEIGKTGNIVSLHAHLNMQGAMREIVSAGDPNEPGVKFNLAVLNIGEALNKGDEAAVHDWGKAAVDIGRTLKSNPLESTGWVVYGTAMYQLKKFRESLNMYSSAQEIAATGKNAGDPTCAAVLLQVLSMKAASYLLLREYEEAAEHYQMMVIEAGLQGNHMMECEGYRLLAGMPPKAFDDEERIQFLQKAFDAGLKLHPETQKFSSLHLVCVHLVDLSAKKKNHELRAKVDSHARSLWGEQWRDLENDKGTVPMISEIQKSMPYATSV